MQRRLTPEHMDDPSVDREQLGAALSYLRWINRSLGGSRALIRHLSAWSARWPKDRPITLLDIGTGSADIPIAACRWARTRGFRLHVTGIDFHASTIDFAREHVDKSGESGSITLVQAEAAELADRFKPEEFDYAHAGLFLHHLPELRVMTVLRVMERLASKGLVWNDLVRSRLHRALINVILVGAPAVFVHDGRVSIEAGFTRTEAVDLARRVGITYARYHGFPLWYRFTLAGEKPGAWRV